MKILRGSQGIALVVVILMMVVLLSITGAALLLSGLNSKKASNLKSGTGAIYAADAGIQHALTLIPTGSTFSYSSQTALVTNQTFANGYSYTVTAVNDPASSGGNSRIIVVSTASGPNGSVRTIKAYIGRSSSSWAPPGAIYVSSATGSYGDDQHGWHGWDGWHAGDHGQGGYGDHAGGDGHGGGSGTGFIVTGTDTNYNNSAGAQAAVTGISSNDSGVINIFNRDLNTDALRQDVTGAGYNAGPPVTASIQQTSLAGDVNALAQNFVNQVTAITCPPKCTSGLQWDATHCPASNVCTLGTDVSPQITYITGDTQLTGYVSGSGVLVLGGQSTISGNFNFHGLVFYIGTQFQLAGNAQIYGSLLVANALVVLPQDSAAIRYSSQAVNMVNGHWGSCCLPQPARVLAWQEGM